MSATRQHYGTSTFAPTDRARDQATLYSCRDRDGTLIADARTTIEEFEERVGPVLTEEEREADIDTLGGLVAHLAGHVPSRGELLTHSSGISFEVIDADPRRVRRLRLRHLPAKPEPSRE